MNITVTTEPTAEPVTLAMAKAHLQVTHNADDAFILRLIKAARKRFEGLTYRKLCTQTLTIILDAHEVTWHVYVPARPFTSLTSIKYYGTDGTLTAYTEGTDFYTVGTDPMELVAMTAFSPYRSRAAYQVIGTAGYGDPEDVPADVRTCLLTMIADAFHNPESTVTGQLINEMPGSVMETVDRYRCYIPA